MGEKIENDILYTINEHGELKEIDRTHKFPKFNNIAEENDEHEHGFDFDAEMTCELSPTRLTRIKMWWWNIKGLLKQKFCKHDWLISDRFGFLFCRKCYLIKFPYEVKKERSKEK